MEEEAREAHANRKPYEDNETGAITVGLSTQYETGTGGFDNFPAPHLTTLHLEASDFASAAEPLNTILGGIYTPEADGVVGHYHHPKLGLPYHLGKQVAIIIQKCFRCSLLCHMA